MYVHAKNKPIKAEMIGWTWQISMELYIFLDRYLIDP